MKHYTSLFIYLKDVNKYNISSKNVLHLFQIDHNLGKSNDQFLKTCFIVVRGINLDPLLCVHLKPSWGNIKKVKCIKSRLIKNMLCGFCKS